MSFATTAAVVGAGAAVASAGVGIAGALGGGSAPSYQAPNIDPVEAPEFQQVEYDPMQGSEDLLANLPNLIYAANQITKNTMKQIENIYPGAADQRATASNAIDSYLRGEVPQDVVDFTNRTVAERTGGTFNPNSGAPTMQMAQADFARSIGLTSLQLQQYGISASQSWQQLAESFTTSALETGQLALGYSDQRYKYDALNANLQYSYDALGVQTELANQGIAIDLSENAYTSDLGQYNAGVNNTANMVGAVGGAANSLIGLSSLGTSQITRPTVNVASPTAYRTPGSPTFVNNPSSYNTQVPASNFYSSGYGF